MGEGVTASNRNGKIDLLKLIGLSCIILAHVNPPNKIFMLRNFDVTLMVFISAYLGNKSVKKYSGIKGTFDYYRSRVKRLLLPTWVFLILFFAFSAIAFGTVYSLRYYVYSFALTGNGIGYVWVILVYFFVALLAPLYSRYKGGFAFPTAILLVYILFEVACYYQIGTSTVVGATAMRLIPYGAVAFWGANYARYSKKAKVIFAGLFGIIFLAFAVYLFKKTGWFVNVQEYKYPPRLYYLSFGLCATFVLFLLCDYLPKAIYDNAFVKFISVNSLTIYLCHIVVLDLYGRLNLTQKWYLKYVIVYSITLLLVFAYRKLIFLIKRADIYSKILKN